MSEPLAGFRLSLLHNLHHDKAAAESNQRVKVVFGSINDQGSRVNIVAQDRRHVRVELIAKIRISQPRSSILRREHDVDENLCK